MGAGESVPKNYTLADLSPDDQRGLFLTIEILGKRDRASPGRFALSAFWEVHSTMPRPLAEALWGALCENAGAKMDATLDLAAVVNTLAPLRAADNAVARKRHLDACCDGDRAAAIHLAFDHAVPWLEAMDQELPAGVVKHGTAKTAAAAEKLLAAAACAAWLIDLRDRTPLPELAEGTSRLLSALHVRLLSAQLPLEQRRRWRLLFSSSRDGTSFTRFVALSARRAPCLVVLKEQGAAGAVFGGFASVPLQPSPQFGGGYASFLFALSGTPAAPAVWRSSGSNANFVYLNHGMEQLPNGLAFGANGGLDDRFFGLWLKDDLEVGRSDGPCATFGGSPCLASTTDFRVAEAEVWAVEEDPPPPSEEEQAAARGENALTSAGVLGSKHEETRKFLEVATGKGKASAEMGVETEAAEAHELT